MPDRFCRFVPLLFAALLLAACQSPTERLVTQGVDPNIESQAKFVKVDLVALLDPEQKGTTNFTGAVARDDRAKDEEGDAAGLDLLENAFQGFYLYGNDDALKRRRNRVQDRLLNASVVNCRAYLRDLHKFQGDTNFFSRALSLVLDAAGTVASSGASQILSASAAASLGVGTTLNDAYLGGATLSIIENGITQRRAEILARIIAAQTLDIGQYTVERAVFDALEYHEGCTVLAGIKQAEATVADQASVAQTTADKAQADPTSFKAKFKLDDDD